MKIEIIQEASNVFRDTLFYYAYQITYEDGVKCKKYLCCALNMEEIENKIKAITSVNSSEYPKLIKTIEI